MAKGARHRVDEPGSHRWRPDIDKHPRSLIEGWAAATDAVRGRATAELPCTRPRGDHGREVRSTRCTRTAGACMTVACESGQGQCQSGKEFSKDDRVIRHTDTTAGHCFVVVRRRLTVSRTPLPLPAPREKLMEKLPPDLLRLMSWTKPDAGRFIHDSGVSKYTFRAFPPDTASNLYGCRQLHARTKEKRSPLEIRRTETSPRSWAHGH